VPENWVDVAVLFVLVVYGLRGLQRGLLLGTVDLLVFALALVAAVRLYVPATEQLEPYLPLPPALIKPIAFLGLWLGVDVLLSLLARPLAPALDAVTRGSSVNALLGLVPGAAKGAVVAGLVLGLALALPLPAPVAEQVYASALGGSLAGVGGLVSPTLEDVFGGAALEGISLATVRPHGDERVPLKFATADGRVDEDAEATMLKLVNAERARAGLGPLKVDPALVDAARKHSQDMLAQGYFAHVDNEGKSPADRVRASGARFWVTGENLALAPTVELAHRGLMDSPGHRANILGSQYGRLGIGVVDAGMYGKMFTQEFAD
jgi:uncharacterized protein YkwD/uncharacterized membrane protein required for colicin V production